MSVAYIIKHNDTEAQRHKEKPVQLKVGLGTRGQTPLATRTAPRPMTPVSTGGLTLFPESHFQSHPRKAAKKHLMRLSFVPLRLCVFVFDPAFGI